MLGEIRQKSATGDPVELHSLLASRRESIESRFLADYLSLEATLAAKAGRADEAEALAGQALATPDQRLAAAYRLAVEATLANLKPAIKTRANKRLKEAFAADPLPAEVSQLLYAVHYYQLGNFKYRGEKSHEKQALALIARCLTQEHNFEQYLQLATALEVLERWKELLSFASACSIRHPREPAFLYHQALAMFHRDEPGYKVSGKLQRARLMARDLPPQAQKILMEKIEALEKENNVPFGFPDSFYEEFDD
jgi:hypothetical protein